MKTEHTPGPWAAVKSTTLATSRAGRFELACITVMPAGSYRGPVADLQSCDHIQGITMAECEANARLISAAPDLLAALIDLEDAYCDAGPEMTREKRAFGQRSLAAARAAIAKARGEA